MVMGKNNVAFCFYLFKFCSFTEPVLYGPWRVFSVSLLSQFCMDREESFLQRSACMFWSHVLTCRQPPQRSPSSCVSLTSLSTGSWLTITLLRKTWFHILFSNCCVPYFPSLEKLKLLADLVYVSPSLLSSLQWVFISTTSLNRLLQDQ